jgi:hypothetical protein
LGLLTGEAHDLYCVWQIFKETSIEVPETIDLINKTAPLFFKRIQKLLFEHLIIGVARFTDPQEQGKNRNLTLYALFDAEIPAQLEELGTTAKNIREIRKKIVAHLDLKAGIDPSCLPNRAIISDIRKSIELIEAIIEIAWEKWAGSILGANCSETIEILNCLQKVFAYDRLEKKGIVPEGFWNYPKDMAENYLEEVSIKKLAGHSYA